MANHIADGALFRDAPKNDGKVHPVMHIALTVAGVKLNLAVWPKTTAKNGTTEYWPVSGDYANGEQRRLVDVLPVIGSAAAPAKAPEAATAEAAESSDEALPF